MPAQLKEPPVHLDLALRHGLSREEYNLLLRELGRLPTLTELGIDPDMRASDLPATLWIALFRQGRNSSRREQLAVHPPNFEPNPPPADHCESD